MIRRSISPLAVALLLIAIAACGGDEGIAEVDAAPATSDASIPDAKVVLPEVPCAFDFSEHPTGQSSETRGYYMGFTTWNYSAAASSREQIYEKVRDPLFGDIIALHYNDGIPWVYGTTEILEPGALFELYPDELQSFIRERIVATVGAETVYLAVDQTDTARQTIAPDFFSGAAPGASFDDAELKNAYQNFLLVILHQVYSTYQSDADSLPKLFLNYSSEVSDLIANYAEDGGGDFAQWNAFVNMAEAIQGTLKNYVHPDAGFQAFVRGARTMVSVSLKSPKDEVAGNEGSDPSEAIEREFPAVHAFIDMVGISSYPYIFYNRQFSGENPDTMRGNPATLPPNWLSQALGPISGGKDLGITEIGWIASDFDVNLDGSYVISSDEQRQQAFVSSLLSELDADERWKFLVWFTIADYEPVWSVFPPELQPLGGIWLSTGLFDIDAEDQADYDDGCILRARPAWTTWSAAVARSKLDGQTP